MMCRFSSICVICFAVFLAACSNAGKNAEQVVKDQLGREVRLRANPGRIVSMAPSATEMLFEIGLGGRIVGVTDYCNYPGEARSKPKIGGYFNPNIEAIAALEPDLVVATADGYNKDVVDRLTSLGIPCYVINPETIDDILKTMLELGRITGESEKSQTAVAQLRDRVEIIRSKVSGIASGRRTKVFFSLGDEELWTSGPGTFIDDLIEEAGGLNIAHDAKQKWLQFSAEELVRRDPDVVVIAGMVPGDTDPSGTFLSRYDISAVKNRRIHYIDPDMMNRPGPRSIDVLETLFELFYPNSRRSDG